MATSPVAMLNHRSSDLGIPPRVSTSADWYKRLQFIKSASPSTQKVAVFLDRTSVDQWEAAQSVAASLHLMLAGVNLGDPPFSYDKALLQIRSDYRRALFVLPSGFFLRDRERLADFALRNRFVSMFGFREYVDAGGLMSYGPDYIRMFRRAAEYVDWIARGSRPADLPCRLSSLRSST
jgi:putative tryptophan/tyrosine transport system substrate-binding protein